MNNRINTLFLALLFATVSSTAQETGLKEPVLQPHKLKISGYIQAQAQVGQEDASLRIGSTYSVKQTDAQSRIGIRRGRIKFTYEEGIVQGVVQIDATERGVALKDAFFSLRNLAAWSGQSSLRFGVFDRPFGYEIGYSSSRRESPERSTIFTELFPDERDLGGMLTIQADKSSAWSALKLEAGLFAGNGINQETDSHLDFIGHLSASSELGKYVRWGVGLSYYLGGVLNGTDYVYTMEREVFKQDITTGLKGRTSKRMYLGLDAQIALSSGIGTTQLRAEYILGEQPSARNSFRSPNSSKAPTTDTYIRPFSGGYAMLVQDIGKTPLSLVLKYDWLDQNTQVAGAQVGQNGTTASDIRRSTFALGLVYRINSSLRLQAYYDMPMNETSSHLIGYESDRKDNVFTARLQYQF